MQEEKAKPQGSSGADPEDPLAAMFKGLGLDADANDGKMDK